MEDELFSSWMMRIAPGNGLNLTTFARLVLRGPIWSRDIDAETPLDAIAALAKGTGTPLERARQTTLAAFKGRLFDVVHPTEPLPWILPLSLGVRKRRLHGLQMCPHCMAKKPYFRRLWRVALITICPTHDVRLIDRCDSCDRPIRMRQNLGSDFKRASDFLQTCFRCDTPYTAISETATPKLQAFQANLVEGLRVGAELVSNRQHDLSNFLELFRRQLMALRPGKRQKPFERLPAVERYHLTQTLCEAMDFRGPGY